MKPTASTVRTDKASPVTTIRVAIVEDDEKIRNAYVQILEYAEGLECVGAFESCEAALKQLDDLLPDVILMDIQLPGMSGIEGVKQIKEFHPSIEIIMFTIYDDDENIFRSLCAGASGYLLKSSQPEDIIRAFRQIRSGAPMSASIARQVLNLVRQQSPISPDQFQLTDRENEILRCLVDGLSDKRIADKLFISPQTVHSHIKNIYEKLQVHSKSEAVSKALRSKLF
ncbi:MAG: response regulator transcription factor [Ignavibacteria bacterium]|nr:response regulator transcription factor [Ignavibacteria bacterium]